MTVSRAGRPTRAVLSRWQHGFESRWGHDQNPCSLWSLREAVAVRAQERLLLSGPWPPGRSELRSRETAADPGTGGPGAVANQWRATGELPRGFGRFPEWDARRLRAGCC